jgi:hypothetical protein
MNAHVPIGTGPLAVSNPEIRKLLQLGGLRFMYSRAEWLRDEARLLGVNLKSGAISSEEVDDRLAEMGALDLVYPELMVPNDESAYLQTPQPEPMPSPRKYRTPDATTAAFWHVAQNHDAGYLAQWLGDHPKDAPFLRNLLAEKKSK